MSKSTRIPNASLDRPLVTRIGTLPPGIDARGKRSAWQVIVGLLVKHPGEWFRLERRYKSPGSAIDTARKTLAGDYSTAVAERLESAVGDATANGYQIYLRMAPTPKKRVDLTPPPVYVDPDQPSIYDAIAAAEAAGEAERITAPTVTGEPQ